MQNSIISEGKTTAEAIEIGLKQLGLKREDVEVRVLDTEKRSFFSILEPRVVKVELKEKEKNEYKVSQAQYEKGEEILQNFLYEFFQKLNKKDIFYKVLRREDFLEVIIQGEDASILIGYRGEGLNSFQTILSTIVNRGVNEKIPVRLDICQYRMKRKKSLEELAEKLAKTVINTGKSVTLEPMFAYERKIIHSKLQNKDNIKTYSIGEEPYRKIVITKRV